MNLWQNACNVYRKIRNLEIIRQRRFSGETERQPGRPGIFNGVKVRYLRKRKAVGNGNMLFVGY
jgi:hypothetical protein